MQNNLPIGAHLITPRKGYFHHGIFVGNGRVVHYAGYKGFLRKGPVEEVSLERFSSGRGYSVVEHAVAFHVGVSAVERARSRLGENRYSLWRNNCEHLATWCITGQHHSEQADGVLSLGRRMVRRLIDMLTFEGPHATGF